MGKYSNKVIVNNSNCASVKVMPTNTTQKKLELQEKEKIKRRKSQKSVTETTITIRMLQR